MNASLCKATQFALEMGFETHNLSSEFFSTESHANWVAVNCQPNFRQVILWT